MRRTSTTRELCEAMWDYVETRREVDAGLKNYDGYSPDYHMSRLYRARADAENRVADALQSAVAEALAAQKVTP